jgi:hypothetical protein
LILHNSGEASKVDLINGFFLKKVFKRKPFFSSTANDKFATMKSLWVGHKKIDYGQGWQSGSKWPWLRR